MQFRTGRCSNDLFCSLASGGNSISVPADGNFVCPQCSKPLVAAAEAPRRSPLIIGALAGGCLALAGGGLIAAGTFMGSGTAAQMPSPRAASGETAQREETGMLLAMTEVRSASTPNAPSDAPAPPPAAPAEIAQDAPPGLAVLVNVGERQLVPWPPTPAGGFKAPALTAFIAPQRFVMARFPETPAARPAALSAEARAAAKVLAEQQRREQLEAKEAANEARAAEQKRIADASAAAAHSRATPTAPAQPPAQRVAMAQTSPVVPPPPPKPAQPASAGVTRPFAAVALSGGAPDYPDAYDEANRTGRVTVSCRIERDGSPHACHVVESRGGAAFGKSVMKWLASGRVRYQPAVRNGAPVAETQQWSVNFSQ